MGATKEVRTEAGRRDHWTCQWDETSEGGQPCDSSFQTGFLVDLAHICHNTKSAMYNTTEWIITLCLRHHEEQHLRMNDLTSAQLIEDRLEKTGGRHN